MADNTAYCHHCGEPIYATHDEWIIVNVGPEAVFFHEDCYTAWQREEQVERNRKKELWEFFG